MTTKKRTAPDGRNIQSGRQENERSALSPNSIITELQFKCNRKGPG